MASHTETDVGKARVTVQQVALMSKEKPASVVAQSMQDLSEEGKVAIKSEGSVKRAIWKLCCSSYPPTPSDLRNSLSVLRGV